MYFVVYKKHVSISSCYRSADQQAAKTEEQQFMSGPLSLLYNAVKSNYQVGIKLRNNHTLLAHVKAFDRHCNMVLEGVKEIWYEHPKSGKGKNKNTSVQRERTIKKMFLRGDSVVIVIKTKAV